MEAIFQTFDTIINIISASSTYDYSSILLFLKLIAVPISIALVCGIAYSVAGTQRIAGAMHVGDAPSPTKFTEEKSKNIEAWQKISEQGNSQVENDRKLAIIAADTLIEKILALAGYHGENLGERLKNIERGDLDSLDDIWEAHKVRNRIAHEADYKLSPNDTVDALARFERALKELEYI